VKSILTFVLLGTKPLFFFENLEQKKNWGRLLYKKCFCRQKKLKKPKISTLTTEKVPTRRFFEKSLRTILKISF